MSATVAASRSLMVLPAASGPPAPPSWVRHSGVGAIFQVDVSAFADATLLIDGVAASTAYPGITPPTLASPTAQYPLSLATHTFAYGTVHATVDGYWRGWPWTARSDRYPNLNGVIAGIPEFTFDSAAAWNVYAMLNTGYVMVPDAGNGLPGYTSAVFCVAPDDEPWQPGGTTADTRGQLILSDNYDATANAPSGGFNVFGQRTVLSSGATVGIARFIRSDYEWPTTWTAPIPIAHPDYGSPPGSFDRIAYPPSGSPTALVTNSLSNNMLLVNNSTELGITNVAYSVSLNATVFAYTIAPTVKGAVNNAVALKLQWNAGGTVNASAVNGVFSGHFFGTIDGVAVGSSGSPVLLNGTAGNGDLSAGSHTINGTFSTSDGVALALTMTGTITAAFWGNQRFDSRSFVQSSTPNGTGRQSTILEIVAGTVPAYFPGPSPSPGEKGTYIRSWRWISGAWTCATAGNALAVPGTPTIDAAGNIVPDPTHGADAGKVYGPVLNNLAAGPTGLALNFGILMGRTLLNPAACRQWPPLIGPTFASVQAAPAVNVP